MEKHKKVTDITFLQLPRPDSQQDELDIVNNHSLPVSGTLGVPCRSHHKQLNRSLGQSSVVLILVMQGCSFFLQGKGKEDQRKSQAWLAGVLLQSQPLEGWGRTIGSWRPACAIKEDPVSKTDSKTKINKSHKTYTTTKEREYKS